MTSDEEPDSYDGDGLNWREGIELRSNGTYQALKKAHADHMAPEMPWAVWVALDNFIEMVERA